MVALDPLYVST